MKLLILDYLYPYPKYTRRPNFGFGTWWYTLTENYTITVKNIKIPPKNYSNEEIAIDVVDKSVVFSIIKGIGWNGATCAPDFKSVIPGTLVHDMLYKHLRTISATWGWSEGKTRRWADKVFNEVNKMFGFYRPLKRMYYHAVDIFGGWFYRVARFFRDIFGCICLLYLL